MKCTIQTVSGGTVEVLVGMSRFAGMQVLLTIDQERNIKNVEGSASLELNIAEVKELISDLNSLVEVAEGKPFVVLHDIVNELLSHEDVKKTFMKMIKGR
jgi:hypothetical protein